MYLKQSRVVGLAVLLMGMAMSGAMAAPVTEESQAVELFARARNIVAGYGLAVDRDILLKFRTRDEVNVENNSTGGRAIELDGFYRPYNPESIWIVSGLEPGRTLGVMAHELTHAWQSSNAPQQDRKLYEGFARFVEYHVLREHAESTRAARLEKDPNPDYGGGLRYLLDLERKSGLPAVIDLARTASRIPAEP